MMKTTFIVLLFLVFVNWAFAQNNYRFIEDESEFKEITGKEYSQSTNLIQKLPFKFNFGGNQFEAINISPAGWLSFDEQTESADYDYDYKKVDNLISACLYYPKPFPYKVITNVITEGKQQCFVVQWNDNGKPVAQAKLYDNGKITLAYPNDSPIETDEYIAGIRVGNDAYGIFPEKIDINVHKENIDFSKNFIFQPEIKRKVCNKSNPKAFGADSYSFSTTTTSYTTVSGTDINSIEDDEAVSGAINIGFTFNYCGTDYTQVVVSSNGWLSFNTSLSSAQLTNDLDGTSYSPEDRLAPLWDDLDGTGHGARCNTSGTAPNRVFAVEWRNWEWNYAANTRVISFKILLYENDNHIEFVYRRESGSVNSGSASIGIQDANGNFLSLDGTGGSPNASSTTETNNLSSKPATGQVYAFYPPSPCTTPTDQPTNLNLTVSGSHQIDGSFTAASSSPDGYLVVRSENSSLTSDPVDGTTYNPGDELGGGIVVQMSSATTFSSTCLKQNTTYYYFIFSYNDACAGGPLYLSSSSSPSANPLTGNATTTSTTADKTLPYTQNFDSDDGWTYGAGGTWARGDQTDDAYGPPSGHSGNTVAGTNLNANYSNSVDDYLVTPTFDLSSTNGPVIDFWMDMESESSFDGGTVQISVNGCTWTTIEMNDPGYSGLVPNDTDVDGLQNEEDGWSGDQPAGEWDEVQIDLFSLTTPGLDNISAGDIIQVRFWFGSDGSNVDPGWYVDDFSIYDPAPCTEPTAQPTNLTLTPGYTTIDGSFTAASPAADGYLVVISTDPTLSASDLPVDGTKYNPGDAIGDGTVVQASSNTTFTATGLSMATTYYFFIFSYNSTACSGINYLTTNPLTGNATTLDCANGTVPYHEDFDAVTTPNLPSCWAIEDNSAPDDDWETSTTNSYSSPNDLFIAYDGSNALDDWAFSPGIVLNSSDTYIIEFYYRARSSSWTEKLEVYYGDAQSSANMSTLLYRDNGFSHTTYQKVSQSFSPSSDGSYYFGWHAYSDANQYGIHVDDIFIYKTAPPNITSLSPDYLYEDRGKQITISGDHLSDPTSVTLDGIAGTVISSDYYSAVVSFPAGDYSAGTLTYQTSYGSTTANVDIRQRNTIPVDASAGSNDDEHQTIQGALDGLYAWYGNTAFNTGDLPGAKTILVNSGTYNEEVTPNTNLNPVSGAGLSIEVKPGQQATVNASGKSYGFNVALDYTTIKGFIVRNAQQDNIKSTGDNCEISYNEVSKANLAGIRASQTTVIKHNLVHNNSSYGIYVDNSDNAQILQNTTYYNGSRPGGAGYIREEDLGSAGIYNWEFSTSWSDFTFVDDDEQCVDFSSITGSPNGYPFEFDFWGNHFGSNTTDSIGVSSNGFFLLDGDIYGPGHGLSNSLDYTNHPLSWHGENSSGSKIRGNDNMLSCFWDDMYDDAHGGEVSYKVRGSAPYRRFIVAWHDRVHFSSSNNGVSVELKIFETTNVIEFHYNDLVYSAGGDSTWDWAKDATIGIKKNDSIYDQYHFSSEDSATQTAVDHNLKAIRYTPNPCTGSEVYIASGSGTILRNNIFQSLPDAGGNNYYVLTTAANNVMNTSGSDYNIYYKGSNTYLINWNGTQYTDLTSWGQAGSNDLESDPKLVDPDNDDYHIKSSNTGASFHNGEWPPFTAGSGTWTADNDVSPALDSGDPAEPYSLEQPDNGSRLNRGCYGNTVQATKTNVLNGIWTGAVDTVWNVPNNWSDGVVPTGSCVSGPGSDATIPDVSGTTGNFPYIHNAAEVDNLTIDNNAHLTIATDGSLTVCGTLTNNEGYDGLIIESDATGDGSLIHNTAGVRATIYRYLAGTQYHYISSPIENANTSNIGIQSGTYGTQLYAWDASMQWDGVGANPPSTIDYDPWHPSTPFSGTMTVGQGYAYRYYPSTLTYQGNVNVTDVTITMRKASTGTETDQGWNLLGNPYASALDWDANSKPSTSQMESAIYLFDDDDGSGMQQNYRYYVPSGGTGGTYGVGTNDATQYIPMGQGFFVRALQDNTNFTFEASARVHNDQAYYKDEVAHPDLLRIQIQNKQTSDEAIIRFIEPATTAFDGQYDARKLFPYSPVPLIYSITSDGAISAINSLPTLDRTYDIPLGIAIPENGDYTIFFKEANFKNNRVFLEDLWQDTFVEITAGGEYHFTATHGIANNRFVLHFVTNHSPQVFAGIDDQYTLEGKDFSFVIPENAFTDEDFGDNLTYTLSYNGYSLPEWMKFDPVTREFNVYAPEQGDYTIKVIATDSYGESAETFFTLHVLANSTALDNTNNNIIVYPNPTNGKFTVSLNNKDNFSLEIINANGQTILHQKSSSNNCNIDLTKYPQGTYMLKIRTNESTFFKKLIKH